MANIKVELSHEIVDGQPVTFIAPCDCTAIIGLKVCHPGGSREFTFKDTHGNDLTGIGNLFTKGAYVKAVLDTNNGFAYIQNADTNAYLEGKFKAIDSRKINGKELRGDIELSAEDVGARPNTWLPTAEEVGVPFKESDAHPGCFYRTVDGVVEWINPPMLPNTEYRTTKRHMGKVVYSKFLELGTLPKKTRKK